MKTIYRDAWKSINKYIAEMKELKFTVDEDEFANCCKNLHEKIKENYMKENPEPHLDRHKLAAIIAVCASKHIEANVRLEKDKLFFGNYLVGLYAALSFMEADLKSDVRESGLLSFGEDIKLCLPDPVICETKSVNAMARMMYWEEQTKTDDCIRVLELANTLFLIEQYTLLMFDIDMESWVAFKRRTSKWF